MADFTAFATRVAAECKSLRTLINGNAANLNALTTTNKTTLVAAINEVRAGVANAVGINDSVTSTTTTWSSQKISTYTGGGGGGGGAPIDDTGVGTATVWSSSKTNDSINAVVGAAPTALNTLFKIASALGNDANYAATTATALNNRIRYDAAQSLTSAQQTQARANTGAAGSTDMGDPTADFVAMFVAALT
jgi:hypothetical protein